METINISLCIPTMDRFDKFLKGYLEQYIKFLQDGIISEIVICDENGNDHKKIMDKYGDFISKNPQRQKK